MTGEQTLLSVQDVAKMLGVSVATVWRRVKDGTLPEPIRFGGVTRWVREELIEVLSTAQARRTNAGR